MSNQAEYLRVEGLHQNASCDMHEHSTEGLPFEIVKRMRQAGGINACRQCIDRAIAETARLREARDGKA
jgi:hypothetical protein